MEKYLIVNAGSTSKRYSLYSNKKELFTKHIESTKLQPIKKIIKTKDKIDGIGIRVVSPGVFFLKNRIIDENYLKKLKNSLHMAPLHIKPTLEEIRHLKKEFPNTPIVGVSDSEFHKTLPLVSKFYSIPSKETHNLQLYRYGYHGISIKSVLSKLKKIPKRTIVCHLGGGSSITAIKEGKSIDTSMGFTPLEGLPMTTRIGNIDPGALIYLTKKLLLTPYRLEEYLNKKCGFLGVSGVSKDPRDLLKIEKTNKRAKLAMEMFVYNIKKYIGAYTAILGGLDLLIFTGAIGESSPKIRKRVLKDMKIKSYKIIKTNEKEIIYKETKRILT